MLDLRHARDDDALEVGQHLAERLGLPRGPLRQLARHLARLHLRLNRQLRDPGPVVRDPVDQLVAGRPELLRSHVASRSSVTGAASGAGGARRTAPCPPRPARLPPDPVPDPAPPRYPRPSAPPPAGAVAPRPKPDP